MKFATRKSVRWMCLLVVSEAIGSMDIGYLLLVLISVVVEEVDDAEELEETEYVSSCIDCKYRKKVHTGSRAEGRAGNRATRQNSAGKHGAGR